MIPQRILRQLEQIDWDFSNHLPGTTKSIHWYPGTFPSDLPTTLIQALSKPEDLVFDPYGGVGTTALEALRQGRKAWLVEANPIGCLAAYVSGGMILIKRTNPQLPAMIVDMVRNMVLRCTDEPNALSLIETDSALASEVDVILSRLVRPVPNRFSEIFCNPPNTARLSEWIEEKTLRNILKILRATNNDCIGSGARLLALAMVSAILRPSSSQTKSWGHIADNVKPKEFVQKDVFGLCLRWLSRLELIVERSEVSPMRPTSSDTIRFWVSLHNWLLPSKPTIAPRQPAQLIVTSPPYADAIDYTLAQRLSLYMFGFLDDDIGTLCRNEIGARRKRCDRESRERWASQLSSSLIKQTQYMGLPSFAAFVLPHKDAGRELGTEVLKENLLTDGWQYLTEIDRSIRQLRARQSWTSIKKETIHIFGRQ